jgi:fatty acid desaturase
MILLYSSKAFLWICLAILIFTINSNLLIFSVLMLLVSQRHLQTQVHDTAHYFISDNKKNNDFFGNYLFAGFIGMTIENYRFIHQKHHKFNGSDEDPEYFSYKDVRNYGGFMSLCLKYFLGFEAFKLIKKYYFSNKSSSTDSKKNRNLIHIIFAQLLLIIFFGICDAYFFYIIWLYLAITISPLLSRLRFLVEHPGKNNVTRTTSSTFVEKLFFAPHNFNYHFEHHMWPMIPPYNLARIHNHIKKNNFFKINKKYINRYFISDLIKNN